MPAHRGQKGPCTVCAHVERVRIELLLAEGAGQQAVGRKYGLSKHAIFRHWRNHVGPERRAALLVGPVQRQALASRVAEESASVIDHLKAVRCGLYSLYDAAVTAGDRSGGALLAGRLHENLGAMARLTGQLASSPLVQVTNNNIFLSDPDFAAFQMRLIAALREFPAARTAVIAEFERLEGPPAENQPPQIAHEARTYDANG